jgi:hypothetical protein
MRLIIFILPLLFFSACSKTPNLSEEPADHRVKKIESNQSAALAAQDEYKRLQIKRSKV